MAGVKGRSGGARPNTGGVRPGAGRPRKKTLLEQAADEKLAQVKPTKPAAEKTCAAAAKKVKADAVLLAKEVKELVAKPDVSVEDRTKIMEELFPRGSRDPLEFLLDVMQMPLLHPDLRVKAAMKAVDFTHRKPAEGGKKEERRDAAESAQGGRFAPTAPPRLVSNRGG